MIKAAEKFSSEEILSYKEAVTHGDFMLPFDVYHTCMPDYFNSFPMHWHEETEIIYISSGKVEFYIDLDTYFAQEGDIVIIPPRILHSFKQVDNIKSEMETIVFSLNMLTNNSTDACSIKYFTPYYENHLSMPYIIKSDCAPYNSLCEQILPIFDIYKEKSDYFELRIKARLYDMFFVLFSNFFEVAEFDTNIKNNTTKNIRAILDYISENYMNTITIDELSANVNLSKHYFMRFFKKYMGTTCIEYINDYRLNIATNMLATTNAQITDIATSVGITNLSYFNRVFKKKYNMTPKEYRKSANVRR